MPLALRLSEGLDEAATRSTRQPSHDLFCTFTPLNSEEVILQHIVRTSQHEDHQRSG